MSKKTFQSEFISRLTHEAICDPKPGDRFQEMCSYWMEVEDVLKSDKTGAVIVCINELRQNRQTQLPLDEYIKKFHYQSAPSLKDKCWVMIDQRAGNKVDYYR